MSLMKRGRPTIGVLTGWQVYTGTIDSFLEHVIRGICAAAVDLDCNLMVACGASAATSFDLGRPAWPFLGERIDFVPIGPWNCDGLIAIPTMSVESCGRYAVDLSNRGYPVIFAGLQGMGAGVGPDNNTGIRQAVRHLVEHGHRRIAFLAGFDHDVRGDSGVRLQCFRQALQDFGVPFDPDLVAYGFHELIRGRQAMRLVLERKVPFSAVLASNDLTAIAAMEVLREAGMAIPQDVAVIGFDNRIETRAQVPPLTTVHYPMFEMGYRSLEMLLDRIEGRVRPNELRLVPTHLVIRESCGCPPGSSGWGVKRQEAAERLTSAKAGMWEQPTAAKVPPAEPAEKVTVEQAIATIVQSESHRMLSREITSLTQQCVDAYRRSLETGDERIFLASFQEILDGVSVRQDDLYTWQHAITVLRDSPPGVAKRCLTPEEVQEMLDQARVMVSEAAKAQSTRQLIRQVQVAEQLELMTSRFFTAHDEDEVFSTLVQTLPAMGINQTAVVYFEPKGEDPVGWSLLQTPHPALSKGHRFDTYQFPSPQLVSSDEPFRLAVLPLSIGRKMSGYVAMEIGPLEPLADIVRQLESSLDAVRLRQEALEGQRLAEEANRLKSRFLSMVSHELRAPLNLITGLSDILLKKESHQANESDWEDLERIFISAQHLDGLIQDVLDLARSDVGQLKLTCAPLDIKEILDEVAAISKNLARDKGLAWRYEVADRLPLVWGDRTRLRQVILNLVNNALKFTTRGEIALTAASDGNQVSVSISDTGMGIPPEEQDMIFHEFRQSERTAARGYGGLGLGLAICRRLVELHGGKIGVCSSGKEGQGAVFTFTIPAMAGQPLEASRLPGDASPRVLLLVEDLRGGGILNDYLTTQGYEVTIHQVSDQNDWLASLLISRPDAVALDLGLTSARGWEILKIMKENPATQDIPVLFYALNGDQLSGSLLSLDYLTKPIEDARLAEALLSKSLLRQDKDRQTGPLILVADDDAATVELHTRLIRSIVPDARILQAFDGQEALSCIHRNRPNLVLLDLMMPQKDGFEVLAEMRTQDDSRDIPVIVITGQNLDQEDMERLNRGVVSVLGKGLFSQDETLRHISAFIQNRRRPSQDIQRVVLKAMAFVHANFKDPISRRDIAASVGLSERHLDRCFHLELGISPITYLNRYRVHQARILLDQRNRGITEVALEVGFSSSAYFARVFRDEVGVSPRLYLRGKRTQGVG